MEEIFLFLKMVGIYVSFKQIQKECIIILWKITNIF